MKPGNCTHFNGIQNACCGAGVNYSELADGSKPGMALRLPCWESTLGRKGQIPVECSKYRAVTDKELADDRAATDAAMSRIRKVMPVVAVWRKKLPVGKQEVIECPACGGRLHLSQAACNGHVWGQCETADCVRWME